MSIWTIHLVITFPNLIQSGTEPSVAVDVLKRRKYYGKCIQTSLESWRILKRKIKLLKNCIFARVQVYWDFQIFSCSSLILLMDASFASIHENGARGKFIFQNPGGIGEFVVFLIFRRKYQKTYFHTKHLRKSIFK